MSVWENVKPAAIPELVGDASGSSDGPPTFELREVETWHGCLEILIAGQIESAASELLADALGRALDSHHDYLMVDLDRCCRIDVVAVKLLMVARESLSCRGSELLIVGARGQVRRALEEIGAFDPLVLIEAADGDLEQDTGSEDPGAGEWWE